MARQHWSIGRWGLIGALIAGAVLLFAACGGTEESEQAVSVVESAAQQEQQYDDSSSAQSSDAAGDGSAGVAEEAAQEDREYATTAYAEEEESAEEESDEEASSSVGSATRPLWSASSASADEEQSADSASRGSPYATTFEDYRRTGFVDAREDDTSTFSLDVDRTSYRLALNWARQGYEIDPASVRAEEWINAFDYGYERPAGEDFFRIVTDLLEHPLDGERVIARVGFQAPELADDVPLNVTLVLDASGSMREGDRVGIARAAAEAIRDGLRSQDQMAVVHFSSDVLPQYTVEPDRPGAWAIERSIKALRPHESTNVQAGLDRGVELAARMRWQRPDAFNYIVLMSDGVANVDATDPFAILGRSGDLQEGNPLRLITIGVGIANYNDYLLEQLAQHGNGWYRYLSSGDEARATFGHGNWLALSRPFADAARAQVRWDAEHVAEWRILGYENRVASDRSFTENRREFAEIPAGSATTAFYELSLTDAARRAGAFSLGSVELRWLTPIGREARSQQAEIFGDLAERGDALSRFGGVVALAADRYSALSRFGDGSARGPIGEELLDLREELERLDRELGHLDSYRDFGLLLDAMVSAAPAGSSGGSGYSR